MTFLKRVSAVWGSMGSNRRLPFVDDRIDLCAGRGKFTVSASEDGAIRMHHNTVATTNFSSSSAWLAHLQVD